GSGRRGELGAEVTVGPTEREVRRASTRWTSPPECPGQEAELPKILLATSRMNPGSTPGASGAATWGSAWRLGIGAVVGIGSLVTTRSGAPSGCGPFQISATREMSSWRKLYIVLYRPFSMYLRASGNLWLLSSGIGKSLLTSTPPE